MNYCVYVSYHSLGILYVGKGKTHLVKRGRYRGSGRKIREYLERFPEGWVTDIVKEGLTEQEAYDLEAFYVDWDLVNDPKSLNLRIGGRKASFFSEESRALISNANTGKVRTQELKDHLRAKLKGRMTNPNSVALAIAMGEKNRGKKHTAESKANMGASRLGKKRGPYKVAAEKSQAQLDGYKKMATTKTGKKRGPNKKASVLSN